MKRKTLRALLASTAAGIVLVGLANTASAHAISIGYENAGPGAVTIWLGTYNHDNHHLEGGMELVGVGGNPFPLTTLAFDTLVDIATGGVKPAGLIDGTTNFYADGSGSLTPTNTTGYPVSHWEGVTFTGLAGGDYKFTYVPDMSPSAEWTPYDDSLNNTFDLTGVVQPTAPEPTSMALFGLGALGMGFARRRRRSGTPVDEGGIA